MNIRVIIDYRGENMKLNVIIPCYNEEGNVALIHKALSDALENIKYELILALLNTINISISSLLKSRLFYIYISSYKYYYNFLKILFDTILHFFHIIY